MYNKKKEKYEPSKISTTHIQFLANHKIQDINTYTRCNIDDYKKEETQT